MESFITLTDIKMNEEIHDENRGDSDLTVKEEKDGYADFLMSLIQPLPSEERATEQRPRSYLKDEDDNDEDEYRLEEDSDECDGSFMDDVSIESGSVPSASNSPIHGAQDSCSAVGRPQNELERRPLETTSDKLDDDCDDEESWTLDARELEDELGDLLQEEMEATIYSLLRNYSTDNIEAVHTHATEHISPDPVCVALHSATDTIISNPALSSSVHSLNPVQKDVSPCCDDNFQAQQVHQLNPKPSHSLSTTAHCGTPTLHMVVPTKTQWHRLQQLMTKQYQILLQQMVLTIRTAHTQKMNKEGFSSIQSKKASDSQSSTSFPSSRQLHVKKVRSTAQVNMPPNHAPKKTALPFHVADTAHYRGTKNSTAFPVTNPVFSSFRHASAPDYMVSGDSSDDVAEALDVALGMLQDLEQNRKDALRYALFHSKKYPSFQGHMLETVIDSNRNGSYPIHLHERILTRSAFSRALQTKNDLPATADASINPNELGSSSSNQDYPPPILSVFDVAGMDRLHHTFHLLDNSVLNFGQASGKDAFNILQPIEHADACLMLLQYTRAKFDISLIPGNRDIISLFTYPLEICEKLNEKLSPNDVNTIRRSRLFTSAEDSLLLRGVNLYGEKEWTAISHRFMPDRGINLISQRFGRLCVLLYEANGIHVSTEGNLDSPKAIHKDVSDYSCISHINPAPAPAFMNVLRWSIDEDIAILKAVPILGHSWAEIASRLIPHRERGHLRKRYQVLERRVKATVKRVQKAPVVCDSSRVVKETISQVFDKKKSFESTGSQKVSSATANAKKGCKNVPIKIPIQPMMISIGTPGGGRRNLFPLSQGMSKVTDTFQSSIMSSGAKTNHKSIRHGFSTGVIQQTTSRSTVSTKMFPSSNHTLKCPSVSKLANPWTNSQSAAKASPSLNINSRQAMHNNIQKLLSKQDLESADWNQEDKVYESAAHVIDGPTMQASPSSFQFSSPVAKTFSQGDSINSPPWFSPRQSVLSLLPSGSTETSMDRYLKAEGFAQMWGEPTNCNDVDGKSNSLPLDDLDSSCTGLSLLQEVTSPGPTRKRPHSIMSSVMSYAMDRKTNHTSNQNNMTAPSSDSSAVVAPRLLDPVTTSLIIPLSTGTGMDYIDMSNMSLIDGNNTHNFDDHCGFTSMIEGGFPGCSSLLPTEFDAIAVLNQMSCSNIPYDMEPSGTSTSSNLLGMKPNKKMGSLFSQVIGGAKEHDANKKLRS